MRRTVRTKDARRPRVTDGALVRAARDALRQLALAKLESLRTREKRAPSHAAAYLLIVVFVAATIGLLAYLQTNAP